MRKMFATAIATAAVAGAMTFGLAATPAQAASAQSGSHGYYECSAVRTILKNFKWVEVEGDGSRRDGLLNRTDLRAVVNNVGPDGAPRHVRKAAYRMLGPLFERLDTARYGGNPDGLISRDDLKAFYFNVCA
jgi:hypothetical protein